MTTPKITIHMVCSVDGYIAKKDNEVSWMHASNQYPSGKTLSDEEINKFLAGIDCYLMGYKTYEHALQLGWPYGDTPVKVLTHQNLKSDQQTIEFLKGSLMELVAQLKNQYQNIWMVGGAMLTKEFLTKGLADELVVTIAPVLLGEGLLFFDHLGFEQALQLKDSSAYTNGMVELTYEVIKS